MAERINVMLVDDHSIVRLGLRAFLDAQPDLKVVGECASGEDAFALASKLAPDVILMDLAMSGMNGVEATRKIKKICPHAQIIILTSYHEDEHIFPALRAGALSYLLKDIYPRDLAEAIRKATRGESVLHPRVAARVVKELRGERRDIPDPLADLSERELDVLRLIAQGQSNTIIAEKLTISEQTVKGHVSNILSKLHIADRTQAAVFAWQQGFVQRSE